MLLLVIRIEGIMKLLHVSECEEKSVKYVKLNEGT